jgi:hypothetical protein
MNNNDLEKQILKTKILSNNSTFKTAFTATLGFYAARMVATILGLITIGSIIVVVGFIVYELTK